MRKKLIVLSHPQRKANKKSTLPFLFFSVFLPESDLVMSQLVDDVLDIVAQKAMIDRARLSPEAKLSDLQISSLDVVEIVFALEDKFEVQIPFNANSTNMEFETVGQVVTIVEKLILAKKEGRIISEADLFPKKENPAA